MLLALDPRVKAATIVGLTCDFRRIMFPDGHHCPCNHFPGVMRFTDHPEISTLGLPAPVQYLTMNDWTKDFREINFPTIKQLYAANGLADHVQCQYFDTDHNYDRPKRQATYAWMEQWVRGKNPSGPVAETTEVATLPVEALKALAADVPANKGFAELTRLYRAERGYRAPRIATAAEWQAFRQQMTKDLDRLLGEAAVLPRNAAAHAVVRTEVEDGLAIERVEFPSEGGIIVPAIVLRPQAPQRKLPVAILLADAGKDALRAETGRQSAAGRARDGSLVVLPDLRVCGELFAIGAKPPGQQRAAWERNGIVWGRPVPGMASTDLRAVLDGLAARPDADMTHVHVISRRSGDLAVAVLFAGAADRRIASADLDLADACFEKRTVPLVPFVLCHGDVLQWAAIWADRRLTLRNVPPEAGDPAWLDGVFAAAGNREGLRNERK
jgi:hypothetical protein